MNPYEQQFPPKQYHVSYWDLFSYGEQKILPLNNRTQQELDDLLFCEDFIIERYSPDYSRVHYRVEYFEGNYVESTGKRIVKYYYQNEQRREDNSGEESSDVRLANRSDRSAD